MLRGVSVDDGLSLMSVDKLSGVAHDMSFQTEGCNSPLSIWNTCVLSIPKTGASRLQSPYVSKRPQPNVYIRVRVSFV